MNTLESGIKNAKNTVRYIFGKGSVSQLESLLDGFRGDEKSYAIYFIDKYFEKNLGLLKGLLSSDVDSVNFVDTKHEPKTDAIDLLVSELQQEGKGAPFAVIGIGGG
ncbi:MAG: alcohol dehydrogenase, partial [Nitrospina sp.]|nr:alcohol dehydrogenase [Nitrospina sp.]